MSNFAQPCAGGADRGKRSFIGVGQAVQYSGSQLFGLPGALSSAYIRERMIAVECDGGDTCNRVASFNAQFSPHQQCPHGKVSYEKHPVDESRFIVLTGFLEEIGISNLVFRIGSPLTRPTHFVQICVEDGRGLELKNRVNQTRQLPARLAVQVELAGAARKFAYLPNCSMA